MFFLIHDALTAYRACCIKVHRKAEPNVVSLAADVNDSINFHGICVVRTADIGLVYIGGQNSVSCLLRLNVVRPV